MLRKVNSEMDLFIYVSQLLTLDGDQVSPLKGHSVCVPASMSKSKWQEYG